MNTKPAKSIRTKAEELEAARQLGILLRKERQRDAEAIADLLEESERSFEQIAAGPTNPALPR